MNRREFVLGTSSALLPFILPLSAGATGRFAAYHDVTASEHQHRFEDLKAQGFRPISLSVSGPPSDARYAAVWSQRPGPGWAAVHNISAAQYQANVDRLTSQGFAPAAVAATGAGDAVFAAIFEAGATSPWYAHHALNWDALVKANQQAFDEQFIPRCLAVYGSASDPLFAGVWVKNDKAIPWSWWWTDPAAYQRYFDAEIGAKTRLSYVSVSPSGRILSVFRDEPIGDWSARHAMSASDYQAEFNSRTAQGFEPELVQAGGAGSRTRYAAIFARNDVPIARRWSVTGSAFAHASDLDGIASAFMKAHSIRAMSIAVARNGRTVANRGYTWAEPYYSITQPDSRFRVASVSKAFTCAAITRLNDSGVLPNSTRAFAFLGITRKMLPNQNPDPFVDQITVADLATEKSRLQHDFGMDFRAIAKRLNQSVTPSRDQLVRYIYGEPLVPSDAKDKYSNSAFTVLTSVIERASPQRSFVGYLNQAVLAPLGIPAVEVGSTANLPKANEVPTYDNPGVGPSLTDLAPDALAPNAYGGQFVMENGEGAGSLIMPTASIARLINTYAVWDLGGRLAAARYGAFDGTGSGGVSRGDGLDFAFAFNRRVSDTEQDSLRTQIDNFLNAFGGGL